MAKKIDSDAKMATIRRSIEESPHHVRRVRCHTLLSEVGIKHRGPNNMAALLALLAKYGVCATPGPHEADLDDWVQLRLEEDAPMPPAPSGEFRPPDGWFEDLAEVPLTTEREVEARFASPLFHALGYSDKHEVMGLVLNMYEGVTVKHPEADLVYFADEDHNQETGNALVLVECKAPSQGLDGAAGQAHSYAPWLKPMYYVVTNGNQLQAYMFRSGPIPNSKVLDTSRSDLSKDFYEVYRHLSYDSVSAEKSRLTDG